MPTKKHPRSTSYLAAIFLALIWGAALPVVKPALSFITPYQFLFLRYLVALPFGILLLFHSNHTKHFSQSNILKIAGIESLNAIFLLMLYTGLSMTPALHANLINQTSPILITLFGIFFLHEKEEKHEWIGLTLSIVGITFIIFNSFETNVDQSNVFQHGTLLLTFALVFDAIRALFIRKVYKNIPKLAITSIHILFSFLVFLVFTIFTSSSHSFVFNSSVYLAVIYMGIFGTIVAFSLEFLSYKHIEASEAVLFRYLQPLVYIPLGILWLHEKVNPIQIFGLLLVLLGVFIAEKRSSHRKKSS